MTYFCSGFFVFQTYIPVLRSLDLGAHLDRMCRQYADFNLERMSIDQEDTIMYSIFALLDKKGEFEEDLQRISVLSLEAGSNPFGVFYCRDTDQSENWMYTLTFSPGLVKSFYSGDPFLSPLSEKLGPHPLI
ncbi:MAG: hypothetical protein AB7I41_13455 [Candidatus Sericytochromatia bacterium]